MRAAAQLLHPCALAVARAGAELSVVTVSFLLSHPLYSFQFTHLQTFSQARFIYLNIINIVVL